VALLGDADFDITTVDLASVVIGRADGVGGTASPNEGPPGPHSVYSDVASPFGGLPCDCHELAGDGYVDLSMKFRTQAVVDALLLDDLPPGDLVELEVSGLLTDGTPFVAYDCVRLVPPGTPPGLVQVRSVNIKGAWIDVTPLDEQLDGGGFGQFQRTYPQGTLLVLTADPVHRGRTLLGWRVEGSPLIKGQSAAIIIVGEEQIVEAVYGPGPSGPGGLSQPADHTDQPDMRRSPPDERTSLVP
jgi:hypothetical protein